MDVAKVLTDAITWLSAPMGKTIALYACGWLLKLWPKFFDKAIPVATPALNLLLTVLGLFAQSAGGNATFAVAAMDAAQPTNVLLDIVLPQLIADGAYNWPRKIFAWIGKHGRKIFN